MTESVPPVSGPLGMRLLAFERLPEESRFTGDADAPVGYCLIALWHAGRVLLVHVRGRGCWELPGGGIEPGESPRQAAARELREETGQVLPAGELEFTGFARTALPDRRELRGALYRARAAQPVAFAPNEEIAAVRWWDPDAAPPGGAQLQTVDAYLAGLVRPR